MNEFSVSTWDIESKISEDGESWERYAWLPFLQMFLVFGCYPYNDNFAVVSIMPADTTRREIMKQLAGSWQVMWIDAELLPWPMPTAEEIVAVGVEEGICDAGRLAELLEEAHE